MAEVPLARCDPTHEYGNENVTKIPNCLKGLTQGARVIMLPPLRARHAGTEERDR